MVSKQHRVVHVPDSLKDSPSKLCDWLDKFTEENDVHLVTIDSNIYVFKKNNEVNEVIAYGDSLKQMIRNFRTAVESRGGA